MDTQPHKPDARPADGSNAPSAVPQRRDGQPDEEYRVALVDAIALIDKTKRDIKAQIHSSAITAKAEKCSVDQVWLRRAKDKIDHLTREREDVRHALGDVNRRIKDARLATQGRKRETVAEAFMRIARHKLVPDVYEDIRRDAEEATGSGG